jgi:hypothetical protein
VAAAVAEELVEVEEVLVEDVLRLVVFLVDEVMVCLVDEVVVTRRVEDVVVVGRSEVSSKCQDVLRFASTIGFATISAIKRVKKIKIRSIVVKADEQKDWFIRGSLKSENDDPSYSNFENKVPRYFWSP